jgi:hypothetical protein
MIGHNELEPIWQETGLAKFKAVSQQLPEETEENYENPNQIFLCPDRDLNSFLKKSMSVNHSTVFFRFKKS